MRHCKFLINLASHTVKFRKWAVPRGFPSGLQHINLNFPSLVTAFIMKLEETYPFLCQHWWKLSCKFSSYQGPNSLIFSPLHMISCVQILMIYFTESWKASFPLQTRLNHHFNLWRNSTELVSCSHTLQIWFLNNDRLSEVFSFFIWFAIESTYYALMASLYSSIQDAFKLS